MAQRVMDCGDAGHILLSKRVADDLAQYRQWRPYLHELGECEVKHGARIEIVNLYSDELGNPATPEKLEKERETMQLRLPLSPQSGKPVLLTERSWYNRLGVWFLGISHRHSQKVATL